MAHQLFVVTVVRRVFQSSRKEERGISHLLFISSLPLSLLLPRRVAAAVLLEDAHGVRE